MKLAAAMSCPAIGATTSRFRGPTSPSDASWSSNLLPASSYSSSEGSASGSAAASGCQLQKWMEWPSLDDWLVSNLGLERRPVPEGATFPDQLGHTICDQMSPFMRAVEAIK